MPVLDMFTIEELDHGDHVHVYLDLIDERQGELVVLLASSIAERQTRGVPDLFRQWETRMQGGPNNSQRVTDALTQLISLVVGSPTHPRSPDKVQAVVAEHLWHLIQSEQDDRLGRNELVQGPSLRVEDHGSDGLVIMRDSAGSLRFRLWEIKKRSPAGNLKPKVKEACQQLADSGFVYLAQASETIQEQGYAEDIRAFAAQMPSLWLSNNGAINAGVAVKAERGSRQPDSFSRMAEHLPTLNGASRRLGVAIESAQFVQLADQVQELLWTGL